MQKKLIALAIAAAFSAPAMADVTVYGIIDAAVGRVSQTGGTAGTVDRKTDTLAVSGGLSGSRLGVKGAEDLDNGMKAVVVLEYALDTQSNSSIGNARQEMLAVAGGFGTFATGYLQTTGYDFGVKFDPTAGSSVSPQQNLTAGNPLLLIGSAATAGRAPRALAYISPAMGGVTVAVNYSTALKGNIGANAATGTGTAIGNDYGNLATAQNSANAKMTATLISVNFDGGPLQVGGVYAGTNGTNATIPVNLTSYALGASYDLSVVKLFATYQQAKNSGINSQTNKMYNVSVLAPVGPGAVVASYAKDKAGNTGGLSVGASSYTVAYLQGLSKTVTAYGAYTAVKNDADTNAYGVINSLLGGTSGNGNKSSMIAVGLKKAF